LQILPEIQAKCMPVYVGAAPCPINFLGTSGYDLKS
jgi:hypothetical protein